MRLVTWNCCRGTFEKKILHIQALGFDIAVVQECARPATDSSNVLWFGDNPRQGIAILAGAGFQIEMLPTSNALPRYVIPVQVKGPVNFLLLAVWTQPEPNYVEPVFRAAEAYKDEITSTPVVIMGDLNSNSCWDKKRKPARDHSAFVEFLLRLGLVSSYHHFFQEQHGAESNPTIYFRWQEGSPYHIDYCFIPNLWLKNIVNVNVGNYEEWKGLSDHRPLTVDLIF